MAIVDPRTGADLRPDEAYAVETQTSLAGRALRTLKEGDAFAVFDPLGDCGSTPPSPEGLFFRDTRYLSRLELLVEGRRPLLLGSSVADDNAALTVHLANPGVDRQDRPRLARDLVAIERTKFLWDETCYERIGLRNYGSEHVQFSLEFRLGADYRDLFEVRDRDRSHRPPSTGNVTGPSEVTFRYHGADGATRRTIVTFDPLPARLSSSRAGFDVTLDPGERRSILIRVQMREERTDTAPGFLVAYRDKRRSVRARRLGRPVVETSNELHNEVLSRSLADLDMLLTGHGDTVYPYAGIPWYSTVFGRDGIITALMMLWIDPAIAAGALNVLAGLQATGFDQAADATPGKIVHECRQCEMARTGEVPFKRYYGTIDATPLFILLAGRYFEQTGDIGTISRIWPNIVAALDWCDLHGDRDGDGFVEYARETDRGLANQGWKDSHDSIFHADGSTAAGPIALCEVQAYVYAAKRAVATVAAAMGDRPRAEALLAEAERLRLQFEERFWCEDIGCYAIALDGDKRPCRIRSSNAGHALFAGIASQERAERTAETLMSPSMFCGWGIRTLARGEARYNPMSYHNGSVWPHDNALIALGFARYGLKSAATRLFESISAAGLYQDLNRLPELYCGFIRKPHRGPVAYPVACAPQAWAAAAPFALVQACLGLTVDHAAGEVRFDRPALPGFAESITITGLPVGGSEVDLRLSRHAGDIGLEILRRSGEVRALMTC
ncbi:MAG TPA: amylo-alpha-1,6-glucosidase [Methylomirabilota bacterium]|nr:amylo-alpha-1,6-glucosidase [Methylomirabilota bacterium]